MDAICSLSNLHLNEYKKNPARCTVLTPLTTSICFFLISKLQRLKWEARNAVWTLSGSWVSCEGSSGGKPGSWLSKANQVPERLLRANQADPFLLSVVTQALLPHSHDPAGCSFNPPTPIYNLKQSKKLPWAGFVIEIVILNPFF